MNSASNESQKAIQFVSSPLNRFSSNLGSLILVSRVDRVATTGTVDVDELVSEGVSMSSTTAVMF